MRVLVTGGAGFIGFHLVRRLLRDGHEVTALDNLNDYYNPALKRARVEAIGTHTAFRFVRMDLTEQEGVLQLFREKPFDLVVNLAAQPGVRHSIDNPFAYTRSNVIGFLSVLEACRHTGVEHLVYASSSSVYGVDSAVPFQTSEPAESPVSLYAATKRSNELMAHAYSHLYGFRATGLRFFTVYGPWGRPDMAYFSFTDQMTRGEPIKVFNEGKLSRDFTYIDDIVESTVRLIETRRSDGSFHVVYNIGRGEPVRLLDLISVLEEEFGVSARKEMVGMQPGDVYTTYADTSELERLIGYKAQVTLEEGIREFAKWYRTYRGELEMGSDHTGALVRGEDEDSKRHCQNSLTATSLRGEEGGST